MSEATEAGRILGQVFRHARQLVLYLLIPGLNFLSPLLFIPAVSARFGKDGWSSLAVAMSLGLAVSVAAEMGWGVVSPQRVAGMSAQDRPRYYRLSIPSRLIIVLPSACIAAAVGYVVVPELRTACAILAFAITAQGMTPSWYFIGIGQPLNVLWSESLPRTMVTLASAALVLAGGPIVLYSILMLLTVPFAQLMARVLITGYSAPTRADWAAAPHIARAQFVIGSGRVVSVFYTTLPIFIVGLVAPPALALFAASERLLRTGVTVMSAVPMRLQGWVGSAPAGEKKHRIRRTEQIGLAMALMSGTGFTLLAPTVSHLVFAGKIDIPFTLSPFGGLLIFTICLSTSQGLVLVSLGRANDITWAIIPSAVFAVVMIGPGAILFGPPGAIVGEIVSECCGLIIQYRAIRRPERPRPRHLSGSNNALHATLSEWYR